jgi:dihydroxyacetone kinase
VTVVDIQKELTLPPLALGGHESLFKEWVLKAAASLAEHEALLTKYDMIVGDGDCGITMKRGATEGRSIVLTC